MQSSCNMAACIGTAKRQAQLIDVKKTSADGRCAVLCVRALPAVLVSNGLPFLLVCWSTDVVSEGMETADRLHPGSCNHKRLGSKTAWHAGVGIRGQNVMPCCECVSATVCFHVWLWSRLAYSTCGILRRDFSARSGKDALLC